MEILTFSNKGKKADWVSESESMQYAIFFLSLEYEIAFVRKNAILTTELLKPGNKSKLCVAHFLI